MALQLGALRDALIDAGADPGKANKAAEELAVYNSGFSSMRLEFATVHGEFARVNGELTLLKWMAGSTLALAAFVLAITFKLLIH